VSAVISECGRYRYRLDRTWDEPMDGKAGYVAWVMLNPSTADAELDDPTIRRCIAFTRSWGYSALSVVNLFALRATDPTQLRVSTDPVGPENNAHLIEVTAGSQLTVAAWGSSWPGPLADYVRRVGAELRQPGDVRCLGRTGQGDPRHPLYVKGTTELVTW
jgi:hypothetical protein